MSLENDISDDYIEYDLLPIEIQEHLIVWIYGKRINYLEYKKRYYKALSNWTINVILNYLDVEKIEISEFRERFSDEDFIELVKITEFYSDVVYFSRAKEIFEIMLKTGQNPWEIISEMGFLDKSDIDIRELILKSIEVNKAQHEKYKAGNKNMKNFFIGDIMKSNKNKINIKELGDILEIVLNE